MFLQWCRDEFHLSSIFVPRLVSWDRTRLRNGTTAETQTLAVIVKRHLTNIERKIMTTEQYPKIYLYRRIVQAKLFIDKYYSEKIDLGNISDEAYFSKFHFIRLFKSIYGKTPNQYLTRVRIEKAQQLLKQKKSVSEVCYLVGYESLSTFSGLFSKIVGLSPNQYVIKYNERQSKIQSKPLAFVPSCYAFMHGWTENSNFEEVKN